MNTNEKIIRTPLYSWRSHSLSGHYSFYCGLLLLRTNSSLLNVYAMVLHRTISNDTHKLVDTGKKKKKTQKQQNV